VAQRSRSGSSPRPSRSGGGKSGILLAFSRDGFNLSLLQHSAPCSQMCFAESLRSLAQGGGDQPMMNDLGKMENNVHYSKGRIPTLGYLQGRPSPEAPHLSLHFRGAAAWKDTLYLTMKPTIPGALSSSCWESVSNPARASIHLAQRRMRMFRDYVTRAGTTL